MAVKSKDEILESINTLMGDSSSDEALAIIEDITDTMSDLETRATDTTNWKQKYEDNDKEWRDKYKSRFFDTGSDDPIPDPEPEPPKMMTFEDLFKTKED